MAAPTDTVVLFRMLLASPQQTFPPPQTCQWPKFSPRGAMTRCMPTMQRQNNSPELCGAVAEVSSSALALQSRSTGHEP